MRRRAITITALVMLKLSAVLWALSLPAITYRDPRRLRFVAELRSGILTVHNHGSYTRGGWQIGPRTRLRWWPYDGDFVQWSIYPSEGPMYRFTLPLWMPSALAAAALLAARVVLRQDAHACRSCGYSRAGLVSSIPCPECGAVSPGSPAQTAA
jgi:hypothetical protein